MSVYCKKIKKSVIVYVHRAVLQAFGPGRRGKHRKYADHIDGDVTNNKIFNLRWVSRKENNSTAIKRLKNSMNAKAVKHEGQVIRGENKLTGEIKYWKTGTQACKDIGCSHVLVYNTLNPSYPLNHAKGWSLQWITILDVDNEKGE